MSLAIALVAFAAGGHPSKPACPERFSQAEQVVYVHAVYHRPAISRAARRRMARMQRCARSERAAANMARVQRLAGRARTRRLSLTPFLGPDGRRWAIPWVVVACESGGKWAAHNPRSPARGPYQLLGHGEPWPANTPWAQARHHQIASALFRSSGLGPWVSSKGCWG